MNIADHREGSLLVAVINEKRIDAARSTALKSYIDEKVGKGERRIVVDLTLVQFVDSSGLGALVFGLKRVGSDGLFALVGVSPSVMRLLSMTRMDRIFRLYPNVREAVEVNSAS